VAEKDRSEVIKDGRDRLRSRARDDGKIYIVFVFQSSGDGCRGIDDGNIYLAVVI